jgi:hypothetical protein
VQAAHIAKKPHQWLQKAIKRTRRGNHCSYPQTWERDDGCITSQEHKGAGQKYSHNYKTTDSTDFTDLSATDNQQIKKSV